MRSLSSERLSPCNKFPTLKETIKLRISKSLQKPQITEEYKKQIIEEMKNDSDFDPRLLDRMEKYVEHNIK